MFHSALFASASAVASLVLIMPASAAITLNTITAVNAFSREVDGSGDPASEAQRGPMNAISGVLGDDLVDGASDNNNFFQEIGSDNLVFNQFNPNGNSWNLLQQTGGILIDLGAVYDVNAMSAWFNIGGSTFDLWVAGDGSVPVDTSTMTQLINDQAWTNQATFDSHGQLFIFDGGTFDGETADFYIDSETGLFVGNETGNEFNANAERVDLTNTSVTARYVLINDLTGIPNFGGRVGLDQVRFYGDIVPEPASFGVIVIGIGLLSTRRHRA
ncbi:MAG: PEP-CTERM sorting domain-containing protein [Pseudomonadota bacterium]